MMVMLSMGRVYSSNKIGCTRGQVPLSMKLSTHRRPRIKCSVQSTGRREVLSVLGTTLAVLDGLAGSNPCPSEAADATVSREALSQVPGVAELYVAPPASTALQASSGQPIYPSITAALAAAPSTAVSIRVAPGRYHERLVLDRPNVSIVADSVDGQKVQVYWDTLEPYQSVVDCSASNVRLRGLSLTHYSKSVANNYGVFIHDGSDLWLDACDICSTSGSGIGIEGAAPLISRCRIHGCANHGLAIFGPLDPEAPLGMAGGGSVKNCTVEQNKGDGICVRSSAEPFVSGNLVQENRGNGMALKDCGGHYIMNSILKNKKGGFVTEGFYGATAAKIAQENKVEGAVKVT
ncbi:pectin lyase fold/virulence factor [Dunaliella salina]|uniref:Pectin lyase fold/virulence factor n=1 Tax=Dunaliella salina TaxID=3046 RepID=A0ABQ7FWB7_DUNSA|nr:pectin lyase fold/virulence factor [Dunaliella salina]|eukprot:KAF5826669.1 pectin lyase fold/virulence factor [Dunaliella salina]